MSKFRKIIAFTVLIITSPIWIIPVMVGYITGKFSDWEDWSDIDG